MVACSGESSPSAPADSGSPIDSALPVDSGAPVDDTDTDGSLEAAVDSEADAADGFVETTDASSLCKAGDLLFAPVPFVDHVIQLLPFSGYLWMSSYGGLARVPLTGGTPTQVAGIGGYPNIHAHGTKLVVVDGFEILELDPVTLTKTKLFSLSGTYMNYFPRTALDGEQLFALRDHPDGSELLRYDLTGTTSTSLWHGPKADGLRRAKDRSFVFFFKEIVTVSDPGSGAPAVATDGYTVVQPRAEDVNASYFRMSTSAGPADFFRVEHGASTPTPLLVPATDFRDVAASDGTRFVSALLKTGTSDHQLVVENLSGGTWTELPCIDPVPGGLFAIVSGIAIEGDTAFVSVMTTSNERVFRIKLP